MKKWFSGGNMNVRTKMSNQIEGVLDHTLILDRRFLDDEQLLHSEQLAVMEEIFNDNVRDREIREISAHFAPIFRNDHPVHLAIWGKTGTGKTLTVSFLLKLLAGMAGEKQIAMRHVHLNLATTRRGPSQLLAWYAKL